MAFLMTDFLFSSVVNVGPGSANLVEWGGVGGWVGRYPWLFQSPVSCYSPIFGNRVSPPIFDDMRANIMRRLRVRTLPRAHVGSWFVPGFETPSPQRPFIAAARLFRSASGSKASL